MYEDSDIRPDASADERILQEARERYDRYSDAWREIQQERQTDLRFICGNPWDETDRKARAEAGRPCINHDELTQYIAQSTGAMRQNPRGIKVEPAGEGADDKSAEFRQNLIRSIEYRSNAKGAYITAYQAALEGSYGFFRVSRKYVSDETDDQEIIIKNIANPDSILYDPDCKEADWSDAEAVFELDPLPKDEFKRQYPDAKITDFVDDDGRIAKDWILEDKVLVANYWRVEHKRVKGPTGRTIDQRTVVQYVLNGVEILERYPQPGPYIPIIPVIGIERYLNEGGGPKRKLFSLVRLARDPQMSLAYLCSQQMEEAGLTPKVPWTGWVGQFETDSDAIETSTKIPHSHLQFDYPEWALERGIAVNLPQRPLFTPNFQQYEIAKDSARRAIQAAMGISPLPTAAQRNNEKSGVALERIQSQQAVGSFAFVDNFDRALQLAGRIIESWIPTVYDTERQVGIRHPDDRHTMVRINTEAPYVDEKGQKHHYPVGDGEHDVTISAGPSYDSQREAASDFVDQLVGNLGKLPLAPPQMQKILSLAIKLKQLGPLGDQMSEIIAPDQNQPQIPPQLQAAMSQAQQHLTAISAYAKQLEGKVSQLEQEKQAKLIDNEYKKDIERMKIEADIAKAEITTKAQAISERIEFINDLWQQLHQTQHESGLQAVEQAHEQSMASMTQQHQRDMADQQAQIAQQQAAQQQAQQAQEPQV